MLKSLLNAYHQTSLRWDLKWSKIILQKFLFWTYMKTKIKAENKNFLHIFKKLEKFIFCEIKMFMIFFAVLGNKQFKSIICF